MDINDLRVLIMVLALVAFVGIVVWAYSRKRKRDFEQAARLPFSGNDFGESSAAAKKKGEKQ